MTGRKGLTWVTALTIASLLLGGGALNALANGRGGGDHGGGNRGQPEHQQQASPAQVNHGNSVQHQPSDAGNANKDKDKGQDVDRHDNNDQDADLVTPPARVTDEERPGLGCGDDNHIHTGPPGNPDQECNSHGDNGDEQGVTDDDDDAADDG
jgi:hypothetical protein